MIWLTRIGYTLSASIVGFIVASILHTQAVLAKLSAIDIKISFAQRLSTTWQDLMGLSLTYGIVILITLTLSFSIAGLVNKKLGASKKLIYPLAGGAGFLLMLAAMQPILNVTLIAGARGISGLFMQVSAGVLAGICFAILSSNKSTSNT